MTARSGQPVKPNHLLRRARLRTPSPSGSGQPMSRQELADAVNRYLADKQDPDGPVPANHVGKLEQGLYTWPRACAGWPTARSWAPTATPSSGSSTSAGHRLPR